MLIAEMLELGRMTAGELATMTASLAVSQDTGTMRNRRALVEGPRALRNVQFQAALAAACHNQVLKPLAKHTKGREKPHKLVIVAIARKLGTIANAVHKTTTPCTANQAT